METQGIFSLFPEVTFKILTWLIKKPKFQKNVTYLFLPKHGRLSPQIVKIVCIHSHNLDSGVPVFPLQIFENFLITKGYHMVSIVLFHPY